MNHPPAPTNDEENQQPVNEEASEVQKQEQNNSIFPQVIGALGIAGVLHWNKSRRATNLLNSIDPEKLVTNPEYASLVKDAIKTSGTNQKFRLFNVDKNKVETAKLALQRVEIVHEKHQKEKESLSFQYAIDAKNFYGFSDTEIQEVRKKSLALLKDNRELTAEQATRIASREYLLNDKIVNEVKNDPTIKDKDRKKEVEKRRKAREKEMQKPEFLEKEKAGFEKIAKVEKELKDKTHQEGIAAVTNITGPKKEVKPGVASRAAARIFNYEGINQWKTRINSVTSLPQKALERVINFEALNNFKQAIRQKASAVASRIFNTQGIERLKNNLIDRPLSFLKDRLLKKTGLGAIDTAINTGLNLIIPGSGLVRAGWNKFNDALKVVFNVDINKFALNVAKFAILVIVFIPILFILLIMQNNTFAAKRIDYSNGNTGVLGIESDSSGNDSWRLFENNYLSLNPNRHDDVKK